MDKSIAIMQPYLFPYIGYFQLLDKVDVFVSYDDIQWINRGWINRHVCLLEGKEKKVTLALKKHNSYSLINQVEIYQGSNVRQTYLNIIEAYYRKAPFFEETFQLVKKTINIEEVNLSLFLFNSLQALTHLFEIDVELLRSTNIDYRRNLSATGKIIDICHKMDASTYINTINGKHLYKVDDFNQEGIKLRFLEREIAEYQQFDNTFIPFLSIIDVLMFNPLEKVKQMIKGGKSIC